MTLAYPCGRYLGTVLSMVDVLTAQLPQGLS
jgi:hypothetical protein